MNPGIRRRRAPSLKKFFFKFQKHTKCLIIDYETCWRSVMMIYLFKFPLIIIFTKYPHPCKRRCGGLLVSQWLSVCRKVVFAQWLLFILTWNDDASYTHVLAMTQGEPLLIYGVQRTKSHSDYKLFTVSAPYFHPLSAYNDDTSHMCWLWPEDDLYWF